MEGWGWTETFKTLIAAVTGGAVFKHYKKVVPIWKYAQKVVKAVDKIEEAHNEIHLIKNTVRAAFHTDKNPVFILNSRGAVIYVNPAWLEMTGFIDTKDAYGFGYMMAIPLEDHPTMDKYSRTLNENPSAFSGEIRFRNIRTHEIINVYCRSEVVYDKEGKVYETIGRLEIKKPS